MPDLGYTLAAFLVVIAVTALTRAAPFLLFGGRQRLPGWLVYLGTVLPAAIMVVLVIYCLRSLNLAALPRGAAELLSVALVAALQWFRKNTLLSILAGTVCYMLLIRSGLPV